MPRFEIRSLMFIFLLMILGKTNCCAPIFVFKQQVSKKSQVIYWAYGLDHYQNGWLLVQVSSPRKKKHGFVDTATRGLWKAQEIFESKSSKICYVSWKMLSYIITKEIINEMSLYHLTQFAKCIKVFQFTGWLKWHTLDNMHSS